MYMNATYTDKGQLIPENCAGYPLSFWMFGVGFTSDHTLMAQHFPNVVDGGVYGVAGYGIFL
jgi:hypothetical protein